jgi:predicted NAD-dependent protein-ADP-ribosyltransferase YbiA (DUF1768 family)
MSSIASNDYFACLASTPCITLPKWLVDEFVAEGGPQMGDFHKGEFAFVEKADEMFGTLRVRHTAVHDEKMGAYVTDGRMVAVLFSRMKLTNFAESPLPLVSCTEQLFMLHKACSIRNCPNLHECLRKILSANKPRTAKGVGRDLKGFVDTEWDLLCVASMQAAIHYACTNEATFLRYQSVVTQCPCPEMAKLIAEGKVKVYECNDDKLYGIDCFTKAALCKLAELEPGFDLEEAMTSIAGTTLNRLGKVLTEFLLAIRDLTYAEYMERVKGVEFLKVVEEEREAPVAVEEDAVQSPAHKRRCPST